jgi:hypothetical protein
VFIHADLFPQSVYKLNVGHTPTFSSPASELSLALEPVATYIPEDQNCISTVLENGPFHQSSPFLEVILCTSAQVSAGSCDPNDHNNRIYIGVIHRVHGIGHRPYYEPRIISLNSSAPFNYVSVSKPLIYSTSHCHY